ncbi:MAG: Uma2 family endonuclease [Symplocastrum torsivum CPER-KK1]|uniref:Uma2 family endonuclease n=1 Tax=Symplocastrum torsivum CPER-KK1 TaxID=450513 RepID=A0A951PHX2_9CYAN|nr:Uma2 family endonuclease [Symplocastrum torsivum CPER-KK1]
MFPYKYPVPQTDPPLSPRETLPTMYDLPSEDPEEPGLPDEFHDLQPQLLSLTFCPPNYPASQVFSASDMNLYYDVRHAQWYKRPDWFGVVGVPRLYDEVDMRLSYVVWQEGINPYVIVELLSPGTEKEDLGEFDEEKLPPESKKVADNGQTIEPQREEKPPRKWEVYEWILRIPYYVVFSRYTNQLRAFKLDGAHYQELELHQSQVWMPELELGLRLWQGEFQGIERLWLRWYDAQGNWIPTEAEQERQRAEQAESRAEEAEARLESLLERLRDSGIDPDTV